ncbi:grass carp reovirus (GCRV)-induced gene 2e [Gymnodraco acuticeps]|uniref:Grass carp reovirus (GCRV)-induced gene 2e n=1 Tax=Gymnodraco acuticeps TaxID=8218 RepID=A0A6P8VTU9_GYMAC|nr:grass carp reovirus (GCRV)-induced gene 2e [Gymnodraco acuticeps]
MQYSWAEDDFDVPTGVGRLGLSAPGDNGKYVMYHGTTKAIAQSIQATGFRQSTGGMLGRGVYLSRDLLKASRYPIGYPEHDKAVIKCLVKVGKVIKIDDKRHPKRMTWHDHGFDTAWVPPNCGMVKSGLEEDCVWDPSRITISKIIDPKPVPTGARGYMCDTDTNMQYSWAEDDFDVPTGVGRLGLSAPGDNGKYVMYHGTTKAIAQSIQATGFRQSTGGMLGRGVYLSRDLLKASRYPIGHPEHDKAVIKCLVKVGKVIKIDDKHHPKRMTWHDHGFDTAWVPPNCGMVKSGLEEDCVWDPSRITISKIIDPKPVPTGARGYMLILTPTCSTAGLKMTEMLPGVGRLGLSAPGDNGKYVMYHGTTRAIAQSIQATGFRQSTGGMLGRGVYLSRDLLKASRYPIGHPEHDKVVIKVVVNVGRVIAINHQYHPQRKTWHDHGFDTAWVPPNSGMVKSGLEEDCVWDPSQITISKIINPKPVQTWLTTCDTK